jgi:hypothetical protein
VHKSNVIPDLRLFIVALKSIIVLQNL